MTQVCQSIGPGVESGSRSGAVSTPVVIRSMAEVTLSRI